MTSSSRLALGTAQWGLRYGIANRTGRPSDNEVGAMLHEAATAEIRTLDTARAYGDAEGVIGASIGRDEPWEIVTKLAPTVAGPEVTPNEARRRADDSLASSRAALGRERLDTVLLHRPEHLRQSDGTPWQVLREDRAAGRIGKIGASVVSTHEAFELLGTPELSVVQVPASLLDLRLIRGGFFEAATRAGVTVMVRSTLLQGVATMPTDDLPDHLHQLAPLLDELDRVAAEAMATRAELFLAWARHRLPGAVVVVGCESLDQLRRNVAAWSRPDLGAIAVEFEARVPELPDAILDPWRWPAAG